MLRLYIGNKNYSSWSLRPWILLRQLNIPFEEKLTPFGNINGTSAFSEFSPTGRVPCLEDDGLTVWDSLAIVEYISEMDKAVWPARREARAWARSVAAEMHSGFPHIRNVCTMNCGLRIKLSQWTSALLSEWRRLDDIWCEGLSRFGGPFLAGEQFTAVDAFFSPVAFRVQTYSPQLSRTAEEYIQRLLRLPYMLNWYESALREEWRDEEHEQEAREAGIWLQDLRRDAVL
ncbi:glutathione S-transferase family protein [Lacimicrobium alkaliphilum]|uniref:Glutathione S-transferase n=1 Tax=Lacimicrobium alkaliphilum TaxID=1526571 RepID=A0A0U2ZIX5_9ALTE|nr:glutathione S-transferase family protein [Lacimicrobium alkaliphilum]ALS98268.1 glutathione S-transferase [Lacimicrobium alkaliphilum]